MLQIAFILSELCTRTEGPGAERAWKAINTVVGRRWYDDEAESLSTKVKSQLWKPLRRLMERAKTARQGAVRKSREGQADVIAAAADSAEMSSDLMNLDFSPERLFSLPATASIGPHSLSGAVENPTVWTAAVKSAGPTSSRSSSPWTKTTCPLSTAPAQSGPVASPEPSLSTINSRASPYSLPASSDRWLSNGNSTTIMTSSPGLNQNTNPLATPPGANAAPPFHVNVMNFDPSAVGQTSQGDRSASMDLNAFLPDGSVDWAHFDSLVSQFGMDVDGQANGGQSGAYSSTFGGLMQWY